MLSYMLFLRILCMCLRCPDPAGGFCPTQPASRLPGLGHLWKTLHDCKAHCKEPKISTPQGPPKHCISCVLSFNGCSQAVGSLAVLQLPGTINTLQQKCALALTCHWWYAREMGKSWGGFGWVFCLHPPAGVR